MTTVEWRGGKVRFIDQTKLPLQEIYIETAEYRIVVDAIRALKIRGAPAIGVAAAFGVALAAASAVSAETVEVEARRAADLLGSTRPTAVNLFASLHRMRRVLDQHSSRPSAELRHALLDEALRIYKEDVDACVRIGEFGATLLERGSAVLTHCNAGALATAGAGTALSVITTAAREGKITRVYVDETRPLLQGARLTAWELVKAGIPVTLIADSSAGQVLRTGRVAAVITGADRIAANGDTANKIGTYPLAVLARRHGVPFYIAAPISTVDLQIATGEDIPIEERDGREITHWNGVRVAAEGVDVFAPAFDVTPHDLITAIVTDAGIHRPPYAVSLPGVRTTP
jgi:methylthioribose-1-phosphate isomerase